MRSWLAAALIAALSLSPAAAGAAPDGQTLIRKSDSTIKADTERTEYRMELVGDGGNVEQTRRFITYFKRNGEEERTLQKFLGPPVFEGTGLLIVDHNRAQNDIWLYLPSSRRIRRVSGQEKSNRYMGTEFSYEDFEDYQISQYDFTYKGERDCNDGQRCRVVDAVPATEAEKSSSGYSHKVYWLEERSRYPVRVEFYGSQNKPRKVLTSSDLEQVNGYWRPRRQVMHNLENGRATRLEITDREVDQPLKDFYVTKRFLRRE
jgi:hypothetical protein